MLSIPPPHLQMMQVPRPQRMLTVLTETWRLVEPQAPTLCNLLAERMMAPGCYTCARGTTARPCHASFRAIQLDCWAERTRTPTRLEIRSGTAIHLDWRP